MDLFGRTALGREVDDKREPSRLRQVDERRRVEDVHPSKRLEVVVKVIAADPGHVALLSERGELPDRYAGQVGRLRERNVARFELAKCALFPPVLEPFRQELSDGRTPIQLLVFEIGLRSEERRVGKECRL